jgi:ATP-dependent DNA ligase
MNISQYKSKIASRYIPTDPEQIGLKIMEAEYYFTSIKYDGYFAALEIKNGKAVLFDRNGNPKEITAITTAAKTIEADIILAGELCVFENGKSTTHREVSAALDEPDKYDIRFGAFDIISYKGEEPTLDVKEKTALIKKLATSNEVFAIEQTLMESRKDIIAFYNGIAGKEEGAVVRSSDGIIYKIKPSITLDLVVLGYALNSGEHEVMRELLLGVVTGEKEFQIVTKCGNGFSEKERQDFVSKLNSISVTSEYTEVSGAKTAFIMVKPSLVVELSCLDIITETTKGTIRKSVLQYDENGGYTIKNQGSTISCISPVFERFREDKKAVAIDAGEKQFSHLLIENGPESNEELKPSTILIREVFTKGGKGGLAVRKFLGVQTNKEETGQFSPFFVLYSDFSAGRKTPLEQEIFLCATKNDLENKVAVLIDENIKTGWVKV